MDLSGHGGPKAQIHLEGFPAPIFFAQVRDGLGYLKGAERDAPILAVYVSDMGRAPNWEAPGAENWIAAEAAHYVVGSDATGGMGAPEIVPFGAQEDARAFAAKRGGRVVSLADIPDDAVFGPVSIALPGADG
jgi:copper chaperone NosL